MTRRRQHRASSSTPTTPATTPATPRIAPSDMDGSSSFTAVDEARKLYLTMPTRRLKRYEFDSPRHPYLSTQDLLRPGRVIEFVPSPPPVDETPSPPDTEFAWLKLPSVDSDVEDTTEDVA
jgi:hypothetical protein